MNVFTRFRRKKLTIAVTPEEFETVRTLAKKQKISVSDFIRNRLFSAMRTTVQTTSVMDAAYQELDNVESEEMNLPREVPPVRKHSSHPCAHLERTFHTTLYGAKDCEGMCTHPNQHGRVCFWPPAGAKDCTLFKLHNKRKWL